MSFTDEQYVNGVKKLTLIYKCEWINRMRVFLRYIDEHFTDNNFGYFPAMLLCVGEPSKNALRDIRRQLMECIDTIETMMEEQPNETN